ncbi:hypothetical protein [Brazilian marseillevirus]|uniref:hypothetical protein n=1 Tax=Brazilian marseillevirus TaxID=1813599 RepID=UPI00078286BC|nr:hypothetical protein A3303_gp003 [Brazilian marseillevirus]AMQ10511.1 hypothetical protein [Brazilian marseillevirus]
MKSTVFLVSEGNSLYRVFWSRQGKETDFVCKRTLTHAKSAYFNALREMKKLFNVSLEGTFLIHSKKEALDAFREHCVVYESDILIDKIKKEKKRLQVLEAVSLSIEKKLASQNFHFFANSRNCFVGRNSLSFSMIEDRMHWRRAIKRTERRLQKAKTLQEACEKEIGELEKRLADSGYKVESHCLISEVVVE